MLARRGLAVASLLSAAALLAACSSDDDAGSTSAPAPSTTAAATSSTAAATTTAATTTTTVVATTTVPETEPPTTTAAPQTTSTDPTETCSSTGCDSTTSIAESTTTTVAPPPTSPAPADIAFAQFVKVDAPVDLVVRPNDSALYVVSQTGTVHAIRDGAVDRTPVLDISADVLVNGEQGMLGLAFSPDGSTGYVNYTNKSGDSDTVEYQVGADGTFDVSSKRLVLEIDDPYANHNGGQLRFGPDGYLYLGMGDGGSGGDPERRALNVGSLLGKIIRIDPTPSAFAAYSIPPDNPFVDVPGARPEVFAVGLRNPWRYSFDRQTGDLWIADVGQGAWEEIDVAWAADGGARGLNFGWSAFEGTHRYNEDQPEDGVTMPIHEYPHGIDCSVSGGVRYRGNAIPELAGWYVFADYCSGQVRAFPVDDVTRSAGAVATLTSDLSAISEVAQDADGELYVLDVADGIIYSVRPG